MKTLTRALGVALAMALSAGLALLSPAAAQAASADTKKAFIAKVASAAQAAQRAYGVPASALIAEAIVDSNWGTTAVASKARNYFNTACRATMSKSQFAKLAEAQVGKKYVLGAEAAITNTNPTKFDCSELVEWLYGRSGNKITDLAASQYNATKSVSLSSPAVGDLVFLRNNPARANGIGHVAVVTKKLSSGDWEIIEARGRAYGVVKTTLSYWKQRKYFAGLRRYSSFTLSSSDVSNAAASAYQYGCLSISVNGKSTRYSYYSSTANSFADRASMISTQSKYAETMAAASDVTSFVTKLAAADRAGGGAAYAKDMLTAISDYSLNDYNVVPFTVVLSSGATGAKVTALQYLLSNAGYAVSANGSFTSSMKTTVKKYQAAKKLESDGEAGPITLAALAPTLSSGAKNRAAQALNTLLQNFGYATDSGATFGSKTLAAVKSFQKATGLAATGTVKDNTWAKLFMAIDPAPTPTVSGAVTVDQTLTATAGTWGGGSVSLRYQWYRGSTPIPGATAATYRLQAADAGVSVRVKVTGSQAPFTGLSRLSANTAAVAKASFVSTSSPVLSGTPKVGQALKVAAPAWSPAAASSYQWYRGATAISGANETSYTVTAADLGAHLTVKVTGTRAGYTTVSRASTATAAVAKGTLTKPATKVSGSRKVGSTLTAVTGSWGPKVSLKYQWYRGDAKIKGATKASYTATKSDKGKVLTVVVTASASGYSSVSAKIASDKIS